MAEITAARVKELREKTGAGMMDCKQALAATEGSMDEAVDWLRKKGLAAAAKKASRVAAEGLIGAAVGERRGALVEVNAETDFVSRNEAFQELVRNIAVLGLDAGGDLARLKTAQMPAGGTVDEAITRAVATIGENMQLRRHAALSVNQGLVGSYVHAAVAPNLGKIGVIVAVESAGEAGKLAEFGRQLAMHVAAANPQWLNTADVDTAALDRERSVLAEQARASGKPENIIDKMVEGRLRKYYEEVVRVEQPWVLDPDRKVRAVIDGLAKEIGSPVACTGFVRFALGEGVERQDTDFAAEVAATLKQ